MLSDWLHSKRMKYISFAVLLFLLMGGIYVYTHRGGQGVKKAEVRPTVKVVTLVRQDMMKRIVLSGFGGYFSEVCWPYRRGGG